MQHKACDPDCQLEGCLVQHATKVEIFKKYWEIGDYSLQRTYLAGLMARYQQGQQSRCHYYILVNGSRVICCRETFMQIHQVTADMLKTVHRKIKDGSICIMDGRGQHDNRPHKIDQQVKAMMMHHIRQYPTYESHYARQQHPQKFLSPDLSIDRMFSQFCSANPSISNVTHHHWLYSSIFRSTGLKIGEPKADTCRECDKLKIDIKFATNAADKARFEDQRDIHQTYAEEARDSMEADIQRSKTDPNYVTKVVDMQQVTLNITMLI